MDKRWYTSAAMVSAVLVLTACGGDATGSGTGEPVAGGELSYATGDAEPTCLDPVRSGNVAQALVASQYLESLFYQDETGQILPWLATTWREAEDHLSWDITVRDDVTFTDGAPLNAEAVAANIAHILDPVTASSTGSQALGKGAGTESVDEFTVRINLTRPDSALLESLAQVWLPIQSPLALAKGMDVNCVAPVGTGPFIVQSWQKQQSITLVRNENYNTPPPGAGHTGPAHLDRIIWRFIPDSTARFSALQAGEVDVIVMVQPEHTAAVQGDNNLELVVGSRPGLPVNFALNTTRAPFNDIGVREAFLKSVDLDSALASVFLGSVERNTSLLSTATLFGVQNPAAHSYDPEQAGKLLDDAGWQDRDADGYRVKDGHRLTVHIPQSTYLLIPMGLYEQVQATSKTVGFEVKIEPLEVSEYNTRRNSWDYDVLSNYYTKNSADVLSLVLRSGSIPSVTPGGYHANSTGFADPELDALLLNAGEVTDAAQREADYAAAQKIIEEQHLFLPLFDQETRIAYGRDVAGFRLLPSLAFPTFYDTWLDRS